MPIPSPKYPVTTASQAELVVIIFLLTFIGDLSSEQARYDISKEPCLGSYFGAINFCNCLRVFHERAASYTG